MTALRGWALRRAGPRRYNSPAGQVEDRDFPRRPSKRPHRPRPACDGPINGERFHAYNEQFLVPTLKRSRCRDPRQSRLPQEGRCGRRSGVGGRLVFLPKYSPDLNLIEQVFAKFKTLLRKAGSLKPGDLRRLQAKSSPNTRPPCAAYLKERRIRLDPKQDALTRAR